MPIKQESATVPVLGDSFAGIEQARARLQPSTTTISELPPSTPMPRPQHRRTPSRALIPLDCPQEKVYCLAVPLRQSIVLV